MTRTKSIQSLRSTAMSLVWRCQLCDAAVLLEQALTIDPKQPFIAEDLALLYIELRRSCEAKDVLVDVLARNPEDVLGLTILATVYRRCDRDLATCETMLRKAFALAPTDARVMTALGALSAARGDYPIACRWFRLAIEAAPQWPTPHYGLALVCARNERWVDFQPSARSHVPIRGIEGCHFRSDHCRSPRTAAIERFHPPLQSIGG